MLCRFRRRTSVAAFEWISLSSASRTHLAARRSQAALLSRDRVNLAIARHSPANLLNSSDGFMLGSPPSGRISLAYPTTPSLGSLETR